MAENGKIANNQNPLTLWNRLKTEDDLLIKEIDRLEKV